MNERRGRQKSWYYWRLSNILAPFNSVLEIFLSSVQSCPIEVVRKKSHKKENLETNFVAVKGPRQLLD